VPFLTELFVVALLYVQQEIVFTIAPGLADMPVLGTDGDLVWLGDDRSGTKQVR
jgi:hypothetical protein